MAHLVGDVVDGEAVAGRRGEAGAARRLVGGADDAEAGDAAAVAVGAERDVPDVEVVGADDLADDEPVLVERVRVDLVVVA